MLALYGTAKSNLVLSVGAITVNTNCMISNITKVDTY